MSFLDLDIHTAIRLIIVSNITVAALLLLFRREEGARRALTLFACAQCIIAIGMGMVSLRGAIPLWLSAFLANILIYIGVAQEMLAFAFITPSDSRVTRWFPMIPAAGAILFASADYLPLAAIDAGSRYVLISSVVIGSLYGLGGINLLCARDSSPIRKVLGVIFVVLALCFFCRAYVAAAHQVSVFKPNLIQSLTLLTWLVATIVCGLGFILVMNEDANRDLRLAAITDSLTTLANRRRFNEVLTAEYFRSKRSGSPLSLILLDVDHFKRFNDRYGHVQGDTCLRRVGQAIRSVVHRASDLPARFGGEEFAVVAPETDAEGAKRLAENVRSAVEALAIVHEGNTAASYVTVSLGVATRYATELDSPEAIVSLADHALYQAKGKGRNRTEVMNRPSDRAGAGPELVRLVWTDLAKSGNDRLDGEHQGLFVLANTLLSAVLEEKPRAEVKELLDQMLVEIAEHFRNEEALFSATPFPQAARHILCHKELLARAGEMRARFERNELSAGDLFGFLAHDVVAQHIFREDRKFFPYLND